MKTETQQVMDGLAELVVMIKKDRELYRWFRTIARRSVPDRAIAIIQASQQMAQAGVDAMFLSSLKLLVDPRVFDAAQLALAEGF